MDNFFNEKNCNFVINIPLSKFIAIIKIVIRINLFIELRSFLSSTLPRKKKADKINKK